MKTLFSNRSRKAWIAGAGALLTALIAGNTDGSLDLTDYLVAALATVATLGTVFGVRNAKAHVNER
jgi:hypothetical protein